MLLYLSPQRIAAARQARRAPPGAPDEHHEPRRRARALGPRPPRAARDRPSDDARLDHRRAAGEAAAAATAVLNEARFGTAPLADADARGDLGAPARRARSTPATSSTQPRLQPTDADHRRSEHRAAHFRPPGALDERTRARRRRRRRPHRDRQVRRLAEGHGGRRPRRRRHPRGARARSGVAAEDVDEVVMGQVGQVGADAYNARRCALGAGLPPSSTAMNVNRLCSSGLQAIITGAQQIQTGAGLRRRRRRQRVDEPPAVPRLRRAERLQARAARRSSTARSRSSPTRSAATRWASPRRRSPSGTASRARSRTGSRSAARSSRPRRSSAATSTPRSSLSRRRAPRRPFARDEHPRMTTLEAARPAPAGLQGGRLGHGRATRPGSTTVPPRSC